MSLHVNAAETMLSDLALPDVQGCLHESGSCHTPSLGAWYDSDVNPLEKIAEVLSVDIRALKRKVHSFKMK